MYAVLAYAALMVLTWAAAVAAAYDEDQEESADRSNRTDTAVSNNADQPTPAGGESTPPTRVRTPAA